MKRSNFLYLTGGLGNQLFQLAAGIHLSGDADLYIDTVIGNPRTSNSGKPEILSFTLPKNVKEYNNSKSSRLVKKVGGYLLRSGFQPNKLESIRVIKFLIRVLGSAILSIRYLRLLGVAVGDQVGFSKIPFPQTGKVIVGYFQTAVWANSEKLKTILMQLHVAQPSSELTRLIEVAKSEKPLIVHVRLGDYRNEKDFGLLSKEYYRQALEILNLSCDFSNVWVFSDEIIEAQKLIGDISTLPTRYIEDVGGSTAESLELMRHGHGYIIGNSTFSWWGAFLSYRQNIKVIAPSPWFKSAPTPKELYPVEWKLIDSHFEQSNWNG
jgi:hypothetical protein